ncbi:MAG: hypothetical protein AVDCRST_MAG89-3944, partial [uncultured Gemmatimonadetes bacterium]
CRATIGARSGSGNTKRRCKTLIATKQPTCKPRGRWMAQEGGLWTKWSKWRSVRCPASRT